METAIVSSSQNVALAYIKVTVLVVLSSGESNYSEWLMDICVYLQKQKLWKYMQAKMKNDLTSS